MLNFDPTVGDAFGMPASICDVTACRVLVGERWATLLQRPRDEMLGASFKNAVHPNDRATLDPAWSRLIEAGHPYTCDTRMSRDDGTWLPCRFSIVEISGPNARKRLFQANVVHLPIEEDLPIATSAGSIGSTDFAAYVAEIAAELARTAGRQGMPLLQHFLAMASTEAGLRARTEAGEPAAGAIALGHRLH